MVPLASLAIQGIGQGLSAYAAAKAAKEQAKTAAEQLKAQQGLSYQQLGQNDRQYGQTSNLNRAAQLDQRAVGAADLQKRLSLSPMADQAAYFLQQRAGVPPTAFKPRDYTAGQMPGSGQASGGITAGMNQAAQAMGQYKPGMGGLDTSALQDAVKRMRNESLVPGEYQAMDPNAMRLQSQMGQNMVDATTAKYSKDRLALQAQNDQLAAMIGQMKGGQTANLTQPWDATQAQADAQKEAARKRMLSMIGLGTGGVAGSFIAPKLG